MLTTIINAQRVKKARVAIPYSRFKEQVLNFLQSKGYIAKVRLQDSPKAKLVVTLKYDNMEKAAIQGVRRKSKPGRRIYVDHTSIPYSYDGMGLFLISTSGGIMDDVEARKKKIGGELVCEIW